MEWREAAERSNPEVVEPMRFASTDHGDKALPVQLDRPARSAPLRVETSTHTIRE